MGVIHITRNNTSGTQTKYMNIRFYYIRDFYDSQIVVLQFVKSENNKSDIITKKNIPHFFERHSSKLVGLVPAEFFGIGQKTEEVLK